MKSTLHSLSLVTGLLALGATSALAEDGEGKKKGPRPGGPDRAALLEKFDKDGDGELNEEERKAAREAREAQMKERRAEMIAKFDTDGDGELNEEERKAAREAAQAAMKERLLKRFDEDGDGQLNADEQAKADKALERLRQHRPGGPGAGPRPDGRPGPKGPGKKGPGKKKRGDDAPAGE